MKIEVNLYATLTQYLPNPSKQRSVTLHFKEGARVCDVLSALQIPEESVKLIFINGVHGHPQDGLKEGDRLGLFPAIGGG